MRVNVELPFLHDSFNPNFTIMKKLLITLCFLCAWSGFAQETLKEANELYNRRIYVEAIKKYNEYLGNNKDVKPQTWMNIADAHYNLHNHQQAELAYKNTFKALQYKMPADQIWQYYDVLRFLQKYDSADTLYIDYLKFTHNDKDLNRYYEEKSRFNEILYNDTLYQVKNLDINSTYADFGGAFNENEFVFTSGRNREGNKIYERDNTPYLSLYKADVIAPGQFENIRLFSDDLETKFHDATATFSPEGKYLYYASSYQSGARRIFTGNKKNIFKLYRVEFDGNRYKKEELPFNGKEYSVGQPFINEDGTKLYFVSDMPGGYGRADIYVCDVHEDGHFSTPRNLGPSINTPYDDFFPYISGKTLYFSSKGHVGFGGFDIYKSYLRNGVYSVARNLGPNMNSNADDFAYLEGQVKNRGYFSSNRQGGKGDDDIYSFVYNLDECYQYIKGIVLDADTGEKLVNAKVIAYSKNQELVAQTVSDSTGAYKLQVGCDIPYYFQATKIGYAKDGLNLTTGIEPNGVIDLVNFNLENLSDIFVTEGNVEKIRIEPIYFQLNRYTINPFAAKQLEKVINIMNEYPDMVIKIESHTDQRGSDSYNQTLSENRAKATRDYLVENNIAPERIESARGYGESRPINVCDESGGGCSEAEYLENRRSDFIVIKR